MPVFAASEYLLSYGLLGDFGRFRTLRPFTCRRGDRVVVQSHRGLELAEVLREAAPGHAQFLPNTSVGQLLRLATADDELTATRMQVRGRRILDRGNVLAASLGLAMQLLDVEVLLDGKRAILHHLRWADDDIRPFVSALASELALEIQLEDVNRAAESLIEPEESTCGRDNCGGGHCNDCGNGGCATCGDAPAEVLSEYLAAMRSKFEGRHALL